MKPTHLSHALLAATSSTSVRQLAGDCRISPSTLSKLISEDRRIDEETLLKLCSGNPDAMGGLKLLVAHLRDEVDRAGRNQTELIIEVDGHIPDEDFRLLEQQGRTDSELKAILHDLAEMVRSIRRKYPERAADHDLVAAAPKSLNPAGAAAQASYDDLAQRDDAAAKNAKPVAGKPSPIPPGKKPKRGR